MVPFSQNQNCGLIAKGNGILDLEFWDMNASHIPLFPSYDVK